MGFQSNQIEIEETKENVRNEIHIQNIDKNVSEEELREEFEKYGEILKLKLIKKNKLASFKAFIEFKNEN